MSDIQTQLPVKLTDNTNTAAITAGNALKVDGSAVTQPVSGTITNVPSGTQPVSGTVTNVPSGTQTVTGSVTASLTGTQTVTGSGTAGTAAAGVVTIQGIASMTAVKVDGSAVTQPVSGTVTIIPSSTQTITGTVVATPTGTQAVSGTVTADTELPAAVALADGANATLTAPTLGSVPLLMNASTVDRQRAVVNSLDSTGTGIAAAGLVAQLDDTSTSTVTENQFAAVRMSSRRALLIEGVTSGTAVTVGGTVTNVPSGTQTISGSVTVSSGTVSVIPTGTQTVAGTITNVPSGTQTVAGTITNVPSGTQSVTGTGSAGSAASGVLTIQGIASMTAVKVDGSAVTQPVSGTVTNVPSGTQTVAGTVTAVPTGTQVVSGTVTLSGLAATDPICSYGTSAAVANAGTGTISYTVTTGKTFYLKSIMASSSGAPCKVVVDYGTGPTVIGVSFYSSTSPFVQMDFNSVVQVAATQVVRVKITNSAGSAQDVYATIIGSEA